MNFKEWLNKLESVDVYRHRAYTPGMVRMDAPWKLPPSIDPFVKHAVAGTASAIHGTFDDVMSRTGAPTPTYQHFTREGPKISNHKTFTTTLDKLEGVPDKELYNQALEKIVNSEEFKRSSANGSLDPKLAKLVKKMDGGNVVSYEIKFFDPNDMNSV